MKNWEISDIEKRGFRLISNDMNWCRFKSDIFELSINLDLEVPLFNFKSLPHKFKGNFRVYFYTEEEFDFLLKIVTREKVYSVRKK